MNECRLEFREAPKLHQVRAVADWLRVNNLIDTTRREFKDGTLHALVFKSKSDALLFKLSLAGK